MARAKALVYRLLDRITGAAADVCRRNGAHQIKTLIDAMAASDLAEMELSEDGWTLRLVRHNDDFGAADSARPRGARDMRPAAPTPSKLRAGR